MRVRKVDRNQKDLVKQMRAIGMSVYVTSMVGRGFVDAVAGFRGINYLFEIKDGERFKSQKALTPEEKKFFESWKGTVHKIESIDDVLKVINN